MKTYWLLTRMMLKNTLSGMNPFTQNNSRKKGAAAGKGIFIGLMLLLALGSVVYLEYEISGLLHQMQQDAALPALAFTLAIVSSLVLGLFQSLGELYQGRDAAWLAVLPASSGQIYAAKLTSLYVSDMIVNIPIIVPAAVLYLMRQSEWVGPVIRLIPIFLFTPALPLGLVALIASLLMRASSIARHREHLLTLLTVVFMGLYLFAMSTFSATTADGEAAGLAAMLAREDGLVAQIAKIFPPVRWAADGFTASWLWMFIFCLASAGMLVVCFMLTQQDYLALALSAREQTRTAVRGSGKRTALKASSPLQALISLEWRDLLRTQSYLLNGIMGALIMPVALVIGLVGGITRIDVPLSEVLTHLKQMTSELPAGLVVCIIAAVFYLCTFVNQIPATAISREGRHYAFALSLPVSQKVRLTAKLLVGLELNFLSMLLLLILLLVTGLFPLWQVGLGFLIAMVLSLFPAALSLYMDARHPKLNWMNETDALKKNFNSFFCIILWIVGAAVSAAIVVLLSKDETAMLIGLCAAAAVLAGIALYMLYCIAGKWTTLPED